MGISWADLATAEEATLQAEAQQHAKKAKEDAQRARKHEVEVRNQVAQLLKNAGGTAGCAGLALKSALRPVRLTWGPSDVRRRVTINQAYEA